MDIGDNGGDLSGGAGGGFEDEKPKPQRQLPDDLPKSLDDRRHVPTHYTAETEMYDAWQGQSQFLTAPVLAKPFHFNSLTLDDNDYDDDIGAQKNGDSDARLMEMLAAQGRHRDGSASEDEDSVAKSTTLSEDEKKDILQKALTTAASNGDTERIERILKGPAKDFVDINARDDEGAPPLIYASCFGHVAVVEALLDAGVDVDKQDKNQWTALMWASTNRHKGISKALLDHGASPTVKSSSGRTRTAFDFVDPESDLTGYLHDSGYHIGSAGVTDDFYNPGFSDQKFEEEVADGAQARRRMMMDSARDLEVDLGNMGIDDQPEPEDEDFEEEAAEFNWSRCLHDQMFVFQEGELGRILDIVITDMKPQRSPSQKPVPANMIFLCARYAHYHANPELLAKLLIMATDKINDVVETHQWDMTILAFWQSNATLLLHYLKKDAGLGESTSEFQLQLAELVNEIFILIIRDAERRMDKVLTQAMLDHDPLPGFEDITFQNEWKLFKRKIQVKDVPYEKQFRPPSPTARAKPSPRNITSLLSSTLFVLDLYDIHSVITSQILAQLLYWLGTELYNRIMADRKYLARSKALQILMNVNDIQAWARTNNRQPEHYEHGSMTSSGEDTIDAAGRHFEPLVQLLKWLQALSSVESDDLTKFIDMVQQFHRLTPQQLIHAVKHYRPEVGEAGFPKSAMKYLQTQQAQNSRRRQEKRIAASAPTTPIKPTANGQALATATNGQVAAPEVLTADEDDEQPDSILRDPALMLPFQLPSSTDMLVSYGAGFGGVNRERERKYIPTVPPEFLTKLDQSGGRAHSTFDERDWENEDLS